MDLGAPASGNRNAMTRHLHLGTWVATSNWCNRPWLELRSVVVCLGSEHLQHPILASTLRSRVRPIRGRSIAEG